MLEPMHEHQHLPSLPIAPSMVEVCMSNVMHYKKLERRHCEKLLPKNILLNDSATQELLQTQRLLSYG